MPDVGSYARPHAPGEKVIYPMDFGPLAVGDAIAAGSAKSDLSVVSGVDASPASHLIGSPTISGTVVSQMVGGDLPNGLKAGVSYALKFSVTLNSGQVLVAKATIHCTSLGPSTSENFPA